MTKEPAVTFDFEHFNMDQMVLQFTGLRRQFNVLAPVGGFLTAAKKFVENCEDEASVPPTTTINCCQQILRGVICALDWLLLQSGAGVIFISNSSRRNAAFNYDPSPMDSESAAGMNHAQDSEVPS